MNRYYGLWLLIAEPEHSFIQRTIADLSHRFLDGSVFLPHLSIHPSIKIDRQELMSILDKKLTTNGPIDCECSGLGWKERWSKTLFLDLKPHDELSRLNSQLGSILSSTTPTGYHPHVSLIYDRNMVAKAKEAFAKTFTSPENLTVDRLAIVDAGVDGDDWKDFTKWNLIYETPL